MDISRSKDDDGYLGSTCRYARRPNTNCGASQDTILDRIADCAKKNPNSASWNGALECNRGQGQWRLVTRIEDNKEVWQDQQTDQIWSSALGTQVNWCQASGNTQLAPVTFLTAYNDIKGNPIRGNGTIGSIFGGVASETEMITITFNNSTDFKVSGSCGTGSILSGGLTSSPGSKVHWSKSDTCNFTITQGVKAFSANDKIILQSVSADQFSCLPGAPSKLQPNKPISYCAESELVIGSPGENWEKAIYSSSKGGMGKNRRQYSPSVRWRLPSIEDYNIASANGIRFVMPDMGMMGTYRPAIDGSVGGSDEW